LKAGLVCICIGIDVTYAPWGNQGVVKFSHMGSDRKARPEVGLKTGLLGICFGIDVTYVRAAGQSRSCPSHQLEEGALCEGFVKRSAAWDR
jgi:hypothetical protein